MRQSILKKALRRPPRPSGPHRRTRRRPARPASRPSAPRPRQKTGHPRKRQGPGMNCCHLDILLSLPPYMTCETSSRRSRPMPTMTVRNLPEDVHRRIRLYAAEHGLSAEAAARRLLDEATRPTERLGDVVTAFARARMPISPMCRVTARRSSPPISRDRPRHQRDLGTDAPPPRCDGHRMAERADRHRPVHHQRHGDGTALRRRTPARGQAQGRPVGGAGFHPVTPCRPPHPALRRARRTEAARIAAGAEAVGTPIGQADAQIAAITRAHGFAIATRDVAPFETAGLTVINPWDFA